jgi:hypothetical protein
VPCERPVPLRKPASVAPKGGQDQNDPGFSRWLQSRHSYDITPDRCDDQSQSHQRCGNIQDRKIDGLKRGTLNPWGESKTSGQTDKDDITHEEKSEAPEKQSVPYAGQVLLRDVFQGAPLRNHLNQHRLDSLPYSVEAVLWLPQTHQAEKEIKPLGK